MSDDVYSDLGLIASPAAGDRVPLGTGPNAGGYSERGDFVWKNSAGSYQCGGPMGIGTALPNAKLEIEGTGGLAEIRLTETAHRTWQIRAGGTVLGGFEIADATAGFSRLQIVGGVGHVRPGTDNAQNLADPALRFNNSYFGASPTVTSDEREKTWRGAPTKAELKAATRIIGELGFYQWNDAIAEKGDEARYHFGARAQRVWAIMAEEKLVAPIGKSGKPGRAPYAFLCFDEWKADKDTGTEAGNRYGVRTDQLIMFLMAAQQEQIVDQEARIRALEAAL